MKPSPRSRCTPKSWEQCKNPEILKSTLKSEILGKSYVGPPDVICFCVSNIVRMILHFSFGTPKLERHLLKYVFSFWMWAPPPLIWVLLAHCLLAWSCQMKKKWIGNRNAVCICSCVACEYKSCYGRFVHMLTKRRQLPALLDSHGIT